MMTQNHAVIVLASGLSQRLGQVKQLLNKDGEPLICYMTKLALATQPQAIIIVIPEDNLLIASAITELATQHDNVHTIMNPIPETGMAHSLYLGIKALNRLDSADSCDSLLINRVLIMGVDQILLDEEHLLTLLAGTQTVVASGYSSLENWSNWQDLDEKAVIDKKNAIDETTATETLKKDIIGLPLSIDYELLKQWQALLTGDKGLRYLIRGLPTSQISTVDNHQLSYDIDTPEQLAHARAQRWLDRVDLI
ncbi:NTP transferase domain-containing protein [Psychrobacter sp. P11G5]|uniref:NTP transferase domain-containing protein n=1 Tax=Psychrobacter sp. P11G5 TaxID=1699624 RepID=UPI00078EDC4C|nr:NTP transferase domain-containing protein [Psychrobacter sp. P11G5]AMN68085.1 MoeA [Psychrobacter sp. P11G5]